MLCWITLNHYQPSFATPVSRIFLGFPANPGGKAMARSSTKAPGPHVGGPMVTTTDQEMIWVVTCGDHWSGSWDERPCFFRLQEVFWAAFCDVNITSVMSPSKHFSAQGVVPRCCWLKHYDVQSICCWRGCFILRSCFNGCNHLVSPEPWGQQSDGAPKAVWSKAPWMARDMSF